MSLKKARGVVRDETLFTEQDKINFKTELDLQNVNNTSDPDKPISIAQEAEFDNKTNKGGYAGTSQNLKDEIDFSKRYPSVKKYGATGDGITDDTLAIQSALDALSSNDIAGLWFSEGTYIISENPSTGYCLRLMQSNVELLFSPKSTLLISSSQIITPAMLQIGDGSTILNNIIIKNAVFDGNEANRTDTLGTHPSMLYTFGPVSNLYVERCQFINSFKGAVAYEGTAISDRPKNVKFKDCIVNNVGEGVRFEDVDNFIWDGGSITNMTSQDNFEPHGNCDNWELRNCFLEKPGPSNSTIEIYPQQGDIDGGLIDNVITAGGEIRVSIGRGTAETDPEVRNIQIRNSKFIGTNYTIADDGKWSGKFVIDNCVFQGPPIDQTSRVKGWGIDFQRDAEDIQNSKILIKNCKISNWDQYAIRVRNNSIVSDCELFNNNQNNPTNPNTVIITSGNNIKILNNIFYDDQETPTQGLPIDVSNTNNYIIKGNDFTENPTTLWATGIDNNDNMFIGNDNIGMGNYAPYQRGVVTFGAGGTIQRIITFRGQVIYPYIKVQVLQNSLNGTGDPLGNANYAFVYLFNGGGRYVEIRLDQPPGKDVTVAWSWDTGGKAMPLDSIELA